MTVKELVPQIDALNGRTVAVKGYLGLCMGYECSLFQDKSDAAKMERNLKAITARKQPFSEEPPTLGIGLKENDFDKEFDRKALELSYSHVIITGKVTNRCRYRGMPACTDRGADLIPTDIEPWHLPVSTPNHPGGARQ